RAQEKGATQVMDFIDAGVPGDLDWTDRPALTQLLDLVEKGALHGVVIYDPDRLARDLGVQLAVTDIIIKHRVQLEFITQQYDASPEGMLFYQLRGAISQFERAKIKERTNRGRKKLLREGIPANNPQPYGLTYHRETNTWSPIPGQAEVVQQIFQWAKDGKGPTWIARQLNEQGVQPPRGGKRWWVHVIQRILANRTYTGTMFLHRWNMEGQRKNRFLSADRRARVAERPQEEWIETPVPTLIQPDLWEAVQFALGDNRRRWSGVESTNNVYLASRLIRCGLCGSAMTAVSTSRKNGRQFYYRCNGRYGERRLDCEMPHLRAQDVDNVIWEEVRSWLVNRNRYEQARHKYLSSKGNPQLATLEAINHQLTEVRSDISRLQGLVDQGIVKEPEVRSALKGLREKEASLAAKLKAPTPIEATDFKPLPVAVVDNFDAVVRREHIRGMVSEIVAFPDGRLEFTPQEKARLPRQGA
ncbi:MAG TPA: recombinase family protein, partial [Symbiobacteriaceae bacterium]|nr:recombinase family protein [Symbiobacteriaceae bacterium]